SGSRSRCRSRRSWAPCRAPSTWDRLCWCHRGKPPGSGRCVGTMRGSCRCHPHTPGGSWSLGTTSTPSGGYRGRGSTPIGVARRGDGWVPYKPRSGRRGELSVSRDVDLLFKVALGRFGRHVDAVAGDIKFPAVVDAADAALFVASEVEGGAAMR